MISKWKQRAVRRPLQVTGGRGNGRMEAGEVKTSGSVWEVESYRIV